MAKATVDKWKLKKSFEVIAPPLFKEKNLGTAVANDHRILIGRVVEVALSDLTGDSKLQKVKLRFRIKDVKGERALADYIGHKITQDYEHSLVRRRTSKIYSNQEVVTKDGKIVVVKSFMVTMGKINQSRKSDLRKRLIQLIEKEAKTANSDDFLNSAIYGGLSSTLKKELRSVYPIRYAIIQKTEIPEEVPAKAK